MGGRVIINGQEITNPVARFFIQVGAVIFAALVVALVLFIVLPIVGVVVAGSVGLALLVVAIVLLALPILLIGGPLLAIILAPFSILFRGLFGRRRRDDW
jgi:hypothetical protein